MCISGFRRVAVTIEILLSNVDKTKEICAYIDSCFATQSYFKTNDQMFMFIGFMEKSYVKMFA